MRGRIETLAVSGIRTVSYEGKAVTTGIFKRPIEERVRVSKYNIEGDGQADLSVHGGRDKAVYVYPQDHYGYWRNELGREPEAAQFGENLTVSGLDEAAVCIGDRFHLGSVSAVVTQPRLPCFKLGIRMQDDDFPARFLQSGRLGFYLRVETEGEVARFDTFERSKTSTHGITVTDLWRIVFRPQDMADRAPAAARCLAELPYLDNGWKRRLQRIAKGTS